jgi:hypothetical protein
MIVSTLLLAFSGLASAETPATFHAMMDAIGGEQPASYAELQAAPAAPAQVFDGQPKAQAKDGLVLIDEKKGVRRETVGGDMECDAPGDGRGRPICSRTPRQTISTRFDEKTYRIVDRDAYRRSLELKGALIGGAIGSLGALLFLLNPIAGAVGLLAGIVLGAALGGGIGAAVASNTPDVFTRG